MAAIAVPLLADKIASWKNWVAECTGPRRKEFEEFNRRMGINEHRVWFMEGPLGPQAIVVLEGPGGETMLQKLASSDHQFDIWFREQISEFHGRDFSAPMTDPLPENLMDWRSEAATLAAES